MPVRLRNTLLLTCVLGLLLLPACGGGDSSSTAPTPVPDPIPAGSAGTTLTQSGCAATYACPNVDAGGAANPTTPTFDRLILSNGTSSSCRADIGPGSPPPPAMIPIEFTVRNPASGYQWQSQSTSSARLAAPFSGNITTAGPYQATLQLMGGQGSEAGQTVVQTFTLELRRTSGDRPVVASCAVSVWGFMRPER